MLAFLKKEPKKNDSVPLSGDASKNPIGATGEPRRNAALTIQRIEPKITAPSQSEIAIAPEIFNERVESFAPVCEQILELTVTVGDKIISSNAQGLASEKQIEKIVESTHPDPKRTKASARCAARLLARRIESPDAVDLIGLLSFGAEYSAGIFVAVNELKKLQAEKKRSETAEKERQDRNRLNPVTVANGNGTPTANEVSTSPVVRRAT